MYFYPSKYVGLAKYTSFVAFDARPVVCRHNRFKFCTILQLNSTNNIIHTYWSIVLYNYLNAFGPRLKFISHNCVLINRNASKSYSR